MKSNVHKIPCYLIGLSFFDKWDGKGISNWTEYSVVVPYRLGRFDGDEPLKILLSESDAVFEWVAGDGLVESLELNEHSIKLLRAKIRESNNGIAVRQVNDSFVPGMGTLLQPFLFFQINRKRHGYAR